MARARESAALAWLEGLGVPVPRHEVLRQGDRVDAAAVLLPGPWIVKPDVALGGKGNLGLVRRCADWAALGRHVRELLATPIGGVTPPAVVVEEFVDGRELYLSLAIDEGLRGPAVRLAGFGGVGFDAEAGATRITPTLGGGLYRHNVQALLAAAGLRDAALESATAHLIDVLWRAFVASEATLLELNPIRWDGRVARAVGLALEFDDNAGPATRGFRPHLDEGLATELGRPPTPREQLVSDADATEPARPSVKFFELGGDVALLVVGGGASLLCFDYLQTHGLRPACYADYSPGAGRAKLRAVVEAGLRVPGVRGAIFGAVVVSLVDVTELAGALVDGVRAAGVDPRRFPIVARVAGPNEAAAHEVLGTVPGIVVVGRDRTLDEACDVLIERLRAPVQSRGA